MCCHVEDTEPCIHYTVKVLSPLIIGFQVNIMLSAVYTVDQLQHQQMQGQQQRACLLQIVLWQTMAGGALTLSRSCTFMQHCPQLYSF